MAIRSISQLKTWFKRGLYPTESQFSDWIDSYWHKEEKIQVSSVENLTTILNEKYAKSSGDNQEKEHAVLVEKFETHEAENTRAFESLYEKITEIESIVLNATGVLNSSGTIKYTLEDASKEIVKNALLNGESLIGAILNGSYTDSSSYVRIVNFVCTYSVIIDSRILEIRFSRAEQDVAYSLYFKVQMVNGHITGTIVGGIESTTEYGKYLPEKYYIDEPGSYDMNKFKLSGGILLYTSDTIIVDNLPVGFTSVLGYCLSNMDGCTQVITDTVLDQTVMRTYGFVEQADGTGAMVWSAWKRIDCKPEDATVVLTGTYTTDAAGGNTYVMDDLSKERIKAYVKDGEIKPIIVRFRGSDSGLPFLEWTCEHVKILGSANRRFLFSAVSAEVGGIGVHRLYFDVAVSLGFMSVNNVFEYKNIVYSSEYIHDRYVLDVSWDMNYLTESGGISVYVHEDITGLNMPVGFTDMTGYVLQNIVINKSRSLRCCTQVVTDSILKKTMMRSSIPTEDYRSVVWLPWKEIGKQEPGVYVVAEYPTDLSGYEDGAIFIKQ